MGPIDYWFGIASDLSAHGAKVYVSQVSSFNSSDMRGRQLLAQVEYIVATTGARKVNLIGHSHGSQSARYVAAMRPDLVASVTAVSGPTKGSPMADAIKRWSDGAGGFLSKLVIVPVNGLGWLINRLAGESLPQDSYAALNSLTTEGAARFNQRFPAGVPTEPCGQGAAEVKGVRYYSWSGVGRFYRAFNPADYGMALTGLSFNDGDNDGLVGRCSSHLGLVIRDDYPMNHFHAVNQIFGVVGAGVDPVVLFREHAARLKQAGL
jgi:triacylglycerol lipase